MRKFEVFGEGLHLFWEGSPQSLAEYDAARKCKAVSYTHLEDAFQRAVGNVVPAQLEVNGFALTDMQQEQPGVFTSTSPDPRMVLERCV